MSGEHTVIDANDCTRLPVNDCHSQYFLRASEQGLGLER
jgi:hypothetical protein